MRHLFRTLRRLGRTVWSPFRAFEEIREDPTWLGAFLVVGLGAVVIAWVTIPVFQKLFLLSLTEPLSPEQLEGIFWLLTMAFGAGIASVLAVFAPPA